MEIQYSAVMLIPNGHWAHILGSSIGSGHYMKQVQPKLTIAYQEMFAEVFS